ncbi:MAG: hypothetical protein SF187_05490 [Deltaproteobacteria bacterium]|nr:hypothetical protein [Deltaproteobacteria bacterium]
MARLGLEGCLYELDDNCRENAGSVAAWLNRVFMALVLCQLVSGGPFEPHIALGEPELS